MKGGTKKETANSVAEKKRNNPFTQEQLKAAWNEFAETKKPYIATYHLLSRGFDFKDDKVIVPLHNPFQETQLNEIKIELLTFLRQTLQNDSIQLVGDLKIISEEDMSHLYMNDKEILNRMIKKNPTIKELKDKFSLDTDF